MASYLFNRTVQSDDVNQPPENGLHRNRPLRAKGNLTYLQFVKLVGDLWRESYPGVPYRVSGGDQEATYPVITYSLQLRKTHPDEPKLKFREQVPTTPGEDAIIIGGQRFQNVINFTITTEGDPELAEELIEAFEDFMLEFTPVFKELGISEIVYARRLPDEEESRRGEGVERRTLSYLVTTEKIFHATYAKLDQMVVRARVYLAGAEPYFIASAANNSIATYGISLVEGEAIQILQRDAETLPGGLDPERTYYVMVPIQMTNGWGYQLSLEPLTSDDAAPVDITSDGTGRVQRVTGGDVSVIIEDNEGHALG